MKHRCRYTTALVLCFASLAAQAEPPSGGDGQRKPSAGAFSACVGKSEGDKVTLAMRNHTMEATCEKFGDQLAARPAHKPDGAPPDPR